MKVISNNDLEMFKLPGLLHKTLSNKHNGGQEFEVWKQIIEGKSTTPVHKHDCDETIVVLRGEGECLCDGKRHRCCRVRLPGTRADASCAETTHPPAQFQGGLSASADGVALAATRWRVTARLMATTT